MAILSGELFGIATSHTTGHNGDLMYRISVGQHAGYQGMTRLVIGDDFLFLLANDTASALGTKLDTVYGFFEFRLADCLLVAPR